MARPEVPDERKRKTRSIKVRDPVYQKLHELGSGSYAKGIEFLVYNYTELPDPAWEDEEEADESCPRKSNGTSRDSTDGK